MEQHTAITIRAAMAKDSGLILDFIRELAAYEKLSHAVVVNEEDVQKELFGEHPAAEVILAFEGDMARGFALFFHNFSTFVGKRGIYLEDLYVRPEARGRGIGKLLLAELAEIAVDRKCGRLEWAVLDWNEPAIRFYQSIGAKVMQDWSVNRLDGDALIRLAAEK